MKSVLARRSFLISGLLVSVFACSAFGQGRINDKDLEALMRNLRDDAKSFRPIFDSAIKKSTIRKTSQEKDAKNLVELFARQTELMLNQFKKTRKGDVQLNSVMSTGRQLDQLVSGLRLNGQVSVSWAKIQTELQQVANAFGAPSPFMRTPGPLAEGYQPDQQADNPQACSIAVGVERAQKLVEECLAVSPATHPPCNAQNSCGLIIGEIKRSCGILGRNAPRFCDEYR